VINQAENQIKEAILAMSQADGRLRRVWWPTLDDVAGAKATARQAAWFAVFVGSVTALIAVLNLTKVLDNFMGLDAWAFIDAGAFFLLSIFMFRMSRIAFVLALALYLAERAMLLASGEGGNLLVAIAFILIYVNGVRGAFAWRRFTRAVSDGATDLTSEPIRPK
jgi:hypothetical protein